MPDKNPSVPFAQSGQTVHSGQPADEMVIFRLSAMGDTVLVTGVLDWWSRRTGARFTVVTRKTFAPLFQNHPAVSSIVGLDSADLSFARFYRQCRRLADEHADKTLVDLHGNLRSRLLGLLWKNQVRRYPKMGLTRRFFLLSRGRACRGLLLAAPVTVRYARALSGEKIPERSDVRPHIWLSDEEKARACSLLRELFPNFAPIVALHPYARHAAKSWPMQTWLRLADELSRKYAVLWIGQGEDIPAGAPGKSMVNRTELRELCALLGQCQVLVTGDSGPMHLASAVDTPLVALFGPTSEEWGFFPQGQAHILQKDMPCRPCSLHGQPRCRNSHACLREISVEETLAAVEEFM